MELGRKPAMPAGFFDDVDRAFVVSQLEGAMDATVDLAVSRKLSSGLVLPGAGAPSSGAEEGRRAEQLGRELAALEPRIRLTVSDATDEVPALSIGSRGGGGIRFLGVPRANLFRALIESVRRASSGDHGLDDDQVAALHRLPEPVHAQVFATPTWPSCNPVVGATIRMAVAAASVSVDVVDGMARMDLVREWGVSGVPTVVLNERLSVEGPVRDDTLFEFVLHAGDESHPSPATASVPFSSCGRMDTS